MILFIYWTLIYISSKYMKISQVRNSSNWQKKNKKILQRKVKTDSRNNCANIYLKIFQPNTLSKLAKHLPIQSSCLPKKFTPRVESNDERSTEETICHSWVSQGSWEQGLLSLSGLWTQHAYLHTQRKHSWAHSGLDLWTAPTHHKVSPHSPENLSVWQYQILYIWHTYL